jgi:putative tricarboxylic transport membrane protein
MQGMKDTRRFNILMSLVISGTCSASDVKPLHIMAPAAPGGGWDRTARAMQGPLSKATGRSVQVYNVPGAGGTIGLAQFASDHAGDPNRLMVSGLVMLGAIELNKSPVNMDRLTPIATLTAEWEAIAVRSDSKYQTFRQLIDEFKANPIAIKWGGGSAGGTDHMLVGLIAREAGVPPSKTNYVAHSGGGEGLISLLSSAVTAGVAGVSEFEAQVAAGRLRLLAVSSQDRLPGVDTPTIREGGLNVTLANWRALFGPPNISGDQRLTLVDAVSRMHETVEWNSVLRKNHWNDFFKTGPELAAFLEQENANVKQLAHQVQASGGYSAAGPRLFPVLVTSGLAVLAAVFLFTAVRDRKPAGVAPLEPVSTNWPAAGLVMLAMVVYAFVLPHAGYILATAFFFPGIGRLLGSRQPARDVAIGISMSVVIYLVFTRWLEVRLPGGLLQGLV